ncbi:MAG: hypothetical protein JW827_07020 [Spirochaetes bacterium]|nr:hypothetical protein [Spirochaetota bacterium]
MIIKYLYKYVLCLLIFGLAWQNTLLFGEPGTDDKDFREKSETVNHVKKIFKKGYETITAGKTRKKSSATGAEFGADLKKVEDLVFSGIDRFGPNRLSSSDDLQYDAPSSDYSFIHFSQDLVPSGPGSALDKAWQYMRSDQVKKIPQGFRVEEPGFWDKVKKAWQSLGKAVNDLKYRFYTLNQSVVPDGMGATRNVRDNLKRFINRIDEFLFPSSYADEPILSEEAENMLGWIKENQNSRTGLVTSFKGNTSEYEGLGFTYDQGLAVMSFLASGDTKRARRVLDFYLKQIQENKLDHHGFYNGYDSAEGYCTEYRSHSGPNAWIGMAALQYVKKTGQKKYLSIAEHAGDFLIEMMDPDGGVRGGPADKWYSTEHNLDAYAFFKQLYEYTGNEKYNLHHKVKNWLKANSFHGVYDNCLITRGKRDSMPAMDVYAWSITALGPEELYFMLIDPNEVMEFAMKNFEVQTTFIRPDGTKVNVTGFDYTMPSRANRRGVVSGEWTAQMIGSLKIMADYYKDKDFQKYQYYDQKVLFYESELLKMKVGNALPYASEQNAETGHGWRTPRGENIQSLASSAYYILSSAGYNPFTGEIVKQPEL